MQLKRREQRKQTGKAVPKLKLVLFIFLTPFF
jgi:hypothetical protein